MDAAHANLPADVQSYLLGYVRRQRRIALLAAVGMAAAAMIAWLLAECLADRFLHLSWLVRTVLLVGNGALAVWLVIHPLRRMFAKSVDWFAAAGQVERRGGPFDERLRTVTSQVAERAAYQGSPALLGKLVEQVATQAQRHDPAALVPRRQAALPWLAAAGGVLVIVALLPIDWLNMPRLLARSVRPLADLPPVTTTILYVTPGSADVPQGKTLAIAVTAKRIGEALPTISFSPDGAVWQQQDMSAGDAAGKFNFTLPAIESDLRYFVQGGDAHSEEYTVRALRQPVVNAFRIHYEYPRYTGKGTLNVENTDGLVEAPVGSDAVISVLATEPLKSAQLVVDSTPLEMGRTVDPRTRECRIHIDKDAKLALRLLSDRGVAGTGPSTMAIHAVADLPPIVRFIQPEGDLRLSPRDVVEVEYVATHEYGVTSLGLSVQVQTRENAGRELAIGLHGDRRYQRGAYQLDLAQFDLRVGDVLRLSLVARDGAGHVKNSNPDRWVVISPRSIDEGMQQRMVDAQAAVALADALAQSLQKAGAALADARNKAGGNDSHDPVAMADVARQLSFASDAATLLSQALLHATAHSDSPSLSVALAKWLDETQQLWQVAQKVNDRVDTLAQGAMPPLLDDAARRATKLKADLQIVSSGQLAAVLIAQRIDLAAQEKNNPPGKPAANEQIQAAARQDIALGLAALSINPADANVDVRLAQLVAAAADLASHQNAIDFSHESSAWIADWFATPSRQPDLDARLGLASRAEGLRPDADAVRGRDWQLAAAAATNIHAGSTSTAPLPAAADYPAVLAAVQKEHALDRAPDGSVQLDDAKRIRADAAQARAKLILWAGETATPADTALTAEALRQLAMQANVDAAKHDYPKANAEDKTLSAAAMQQAQAAQPNAQNQSNPAQQVTPQQVQQLQQKLQQSMQSAQDLDAIKTKQDQLIQQTQQAGQQQLADLARQQKEVADAVNNVDRRQKQQEKADQVASDNPDAAAAANNPEQPPNNPDADSPDSREDVLATIQAAMERLAAMPQQLNDARDATAQRRQAAGKADSARKAVDTAGANASDAAKGLAKQTADELADAQAAQDKAAKPVHPDVSEMVSQKLAGFSPETAPAVDAVDQKLTPALRQLQQTMNGDDAGAVDKSVADSLAAIKAVQDQLRLAQDAMVERDPLVAAKVFAREAAQDLAQQKQQQQQDAQKQQAGQQQMKTSQALSKAWAQSIQQSQSIRSSMVPGNPSMSGQLNWQSARQMLGGASSQAMQQLAHLGDFSDWAKLHERDPNAPLDLSRPQDQAPGFEDALQAYFEALSQSREPGK